MTYNVFGGTLNLPQQLVPIVQYTLGKTVLNLT